MIPWMRGQIAEAWHSRKSSRTAERHSLTLSSSHENDTTGMSTITVQSPPVPGNFNVKIVSVDGKVKSFFVDSESTIEDLKTKAIYSFNGSEEDIAKFHLVHAAHQRQLTNDCCIKNEGINENDELLLVETQPDIRKKNLSDGGLRSPSKSTIMEVTQDLAVQNPLKVAPVIDCPVDFESELRKILITLVTASAKILVHSPKATKYSELLKEKLESRCQSTADPKIASDLMDMGFSEKQVSKVLRLQKSNMTEALEWLIEHEDDMDDSESDEEIFNVKHSENRSTVKEDNLINTVNLLLESYRKSKKLEFVPKHKLMRSFMEMGFEEKNIIQALKITGNDYSNTCKWLLGERGENLRDADEGLDPEGHIYKAIMSNPHIQLSLTNPRMLIAYLALIETPASMNIWMKDPDVSPIIKQIWKTYHIEKHAINVNRFQTATDP